MESWSFPDGNITQLLESRRIDSHHDLKTGKTIGKGHVPGGLYLFDVFSPITCVGRKLNAFELHYQDVNKKLQMHSSLVRRLALKKDMEGHQGCVNAIAWNSKGTLLLSGSDDTRINLWSYPDLEIVHTIDSGHSANIFCTKFVPETSDELVVSGAGDAEVRLFNLSRLRGMRSEENVLEATSVFQCHSNRVKKLSVEVGNPHVIWSASEDGTLRQHDFRECSSCPPAGASNQECRNVLLDLRSGAKRSLACPPRQCLALKSCDISSTRPHQILVGGSDAFARLYDRRMLPPLSSSRTKMKPPPCVSYFCPMHLSEHRRSSLHLTHVTFSPNGDEVLLSYSGEYVYLMDLNSGNKSIMRYTAEDVQKHLYLAPSSDESELCAPAVSSNQFTESKSTLRKFDIYKKLVQIAEKALNEGSNYLCGIDACNEVLDGKGPQISNALRHECLCIRAALLLERKWKNDAYMAIRDCNKARSIYPSSFKAHYYKSEALLQLGKYNKALNYALAAQSIDRSSSQAVKMVQSIRDHIAAEKKKTDNKENKRDDVRRGRIRALNNVLIRSEFNSEGPQDTHPYEREDSDFEELELDIETSLSGDEGRGSISVRFHQNDDSLRENCNTNGSNRSPPSSSQHESSSYQPELAIDMKQRYVGHCNVGTDIKQASFLGQQGEFVASGSDDGRWFIWEKRTGRLIKMLAGDDAVVNCVQCHPFDCAVATSGIDSTIKMWTPHAQVPSMVASGTGPETEDILDALESNQRELHRNREAILPFEFLERLGMHEYEFTEGTLHPFECAQS
ncbi:DDB1- and CUL4-associated factor 6 [Iris pallida]|uniref:DDB1- and CUL4-associated factor 6 n=1 Tax=Iris pallida TaxID=29817 RepID=A0AAX6G5J6_IRIPA|nr:DDB1- and CUL4-associated factor 6 [Iris pallida]